MSGSNCGSSPMGHLQSSAARTAAAVLVLVALWPSRSHEQQQPKVSQRWEQVGSLTLKGTDALTVQSKAGYSLTFFIRPVEDLERREKKGPGFKVKVEDHCTAPLQCYYDICDCPTESRPFVQLLGEIQRGWFAGQPLFETDRWTRAGDFIEFQLPASFLPKGDLALWPGYHAEAVVNGVKVLPAPGLYRYVRIVRE